jgi:hypothetical protein
MPGDAKQARGIGRSGVAAAPGGPLPVSFRSVPVQLAQVVRGAGEQPSAFARGQAAAGHHGQLLAGLQLPERQFHGAGPPPWRRTVYTTG